MKQALAFSPVYTPGQASSPDQVIETVRKVQRCGRYRSMEEKPFRIAKAVFELKTRAGGL